MSEEQYNRWFDRTMKENHVEEDVNVNQLFAYTKECLEHRNAFLLTVIHHNSMEQKKRAIQLFCEMNNIA